MGSVKLTNKAIEDLSEIWLYTFDQWSPLQADKYYLLLLGHCQEIADGRVVGKSYSEISPGLYGTPTGQHIIFYEQAHDEILVLRILHSRMDLRSKLLP